jgi:hypothetical protein
MEQVSIICVPKPTSSIARNSKIYPNLDFWFENEPSGNPTAFFFYLPCLFLCHFTSATAWPWLRMKKSKKGALPKEIK